MQLDNICRFTTVFVVALLLGVFQTVEHLAAKVEKHQDAQVVGVVQFHHRPILMMKHNNMIHQIRNNVQSRSYQLRNQRSIQEQESVKANQYIVKFKTHPKKILPSKRQIKACIPLARDNTYIIRAKEEQIDRLRHYIDWIGPYTPDLKSRVNFKNIEHNAKKKRKNHGKRTHSIKQSKKQEKLSLNIKLIHDVDTVEKKQEMKEARNIANELRDEISRCANIKKHTDYDNIYVHSKKKLSIQVSASSVHQISEILKGHPSVHWVEIQRDHKILNRYANELIQSGAQLHISTRESTQRVKSQNTIEQCSNSPNCVSQSNTKSKRNTNIQSDQNIAFTWTPIWDHGITGKGEIVGCSDTGIDSDNCLFRDDKNDVPFDRIDTSHRKIVSYQRSQALNPYGEISTADKKDTVNGHGTHVAGSIAGSVLQSSTNYNKLSQYNGISPDAKLFFTDLHNPNEQGLLIPRDLYDDLFTQPYENGVRIHSNSWGCSSPFSCSYNCNCTLNFAIDGLGSVGDHVSNEACLQNFGTRCCEYCNMYDSQSEDIDEFTNDHDDFVVLIAAGNDGSSSKEGNIGSPATSKNAIAVGASSSTNAGFEDSVNYQDISDNLKLVKEYFGIETEEQCCQYSGLEEHMIKLSCCRSYIKADYREKKHIYNEHNLAVFSSRGPADGGFAKPDVVSVGYKVISAHSDGSLETNQCGTMPPENDNEAALLIKEGTSMATPVTAGGVALVRQYLRDYQQMENPSGPLLKAMIIHSALPLSGNVSLDSDETNNQKLSLQSLPSPNSFEGHGIVSLGRTLKFSDSDFELFLEDRQHIDSDTHNQLYCFHVKESSQSSFFGATTAWYDEPTSPATKPHLINDFDLSVYLYDMDSGSAVSFIGNKVYSHDKTHDKTNPVEKVFLRESDYRIPADHTFVVMVNGSSSEIEKPYSIVVTHSQNIERVDCSTHFASTSVKFAPTLQRGQQQDHQSFIPHNLLLKSVFVGSAVGVVLSILIALLTLARMKKNWRPTRLNEDQEQREQPNYA